MTKFTQAAIIAALMLFVLQAATSGSVAQTENKCRSVPEAAARLACYDRAFPPLQPRQTQAAKPVPAIKKIDVGNLCRPKEVVEAMKKLLPPKSDFETAVQYESKVKSLILTDPLFSRDLICENSKPHLIKYNAEKSSFDVFSLGTWDAEDKNTGAYQGTNAYGASVTVLKKDQWRWEVEGTGLGSFQIPMKSDEAERRSGRIQVAVMGSVRPPFFKEEKHTSVPTFRSPEEIQNVKWQVFLAPRLLLAFDKESGEVFWTAPLVQCKRDYSESTDLRVGSCDKR